jgi:HEXXH motif-containing protein
MTLFDLPFLVSLMGEFRRSMKALVADLCDELEQCYPGPVRRLGIPVDLIRLLSKDMSLEDYSHWRIVGWIETLNDLVYFIDLHEQAKREDRDIDFIEQLYAECRQSWYEHSYAEELFPDGTVCDGTLSSRIQLLCRRLAEEVGRQAALWKPEISCEWIRHMRHRRWQVGCDVAANFDRADLPWTFPVGTKESVYHVPRSVREALRSRACRPTLIVTATEISLACENRRVPFYTAFPDETWHWPRQDPMVLRRTPWGTLTMGPTLVYDRPRVPTKVRPTPHHVACKMQRALSVIEQAWPGGNECLALMTSRIVPLKAPGVVSFSYRHQPGLSFINCFDRDNLDLIDDLIHENSHHHLNLLLRKYELYRDDGNREVFYSPWRRSLRPIRGILHASFTFAVGACLFERLSSWASGSSGRRRWRRRGLSRSDLDRARFRALEEIASVRYSLRDLRDAGRHFGWITKTGDMVVASLARAVAQAKRRMDRAKNSALPSPYKKNLVRHVQELAAARKRYRAGSGDGRRTKSYDPRSI